MRKFPLVALLSSSLCLAVQGFGADNIKGQVTGGGAPIAKSTVTLWEAGADAPRKLAETITNDGGRFEVRAKDAHNDSILYLTANGGVPKASKASGDNPAIALLAIVGNNPLASVVINEMTTVASVWTSAQFLDGAALKGHALGLKIAAGNVPNFVDLATGGWGGIIQDPLNSSQTPTMANFATLADVLSGCVTQVAADACSSLFGAATGPTEGTPTSTLTAAESIARASWYKPERLFSLLDAFYPLQKGKIMRAVPFMPYLGVAPSAWVLPLKFDGGGYRAGGKAMFDSEGNLWVGDNFTVGWQAQDTLWQGNFTSSHPTASRFRPSLPVFPAADSPEAHSVTPLTTKTMFGSPVMAATPSRSSISTASHWQVQTASPSTASSA